MDFQAAVDAYCTIWVKPVVGSIQISSEWVVIFTPINSFIHSFGDYPEKFHPHLHPVR
jgi:hypothetical protein